MSRRPGLPRFEVKHIATDKLHLKLEPRYAVIDHERDGAVVFRHQWARTAEEERDRLNVLDGACTACKGSGSVIVDYGYEGNPLGEDCQHCGGTGREPNGDQA